MSPRVRINSRDLLIFANRGTAGKDYAALIEAIDRLAGTRISTNIRTADEEQYDTFGLIDAASIRRSTASMAGSCGARSSSRSGYSMRSAPRRS